MRYSVLSRSGCSILNISNIGYAADPSVTRFGPGARNFYIIHYVISGSGFFNGRRVSPGQGFLITPGMQEYYFPDEQDPWEFLWIVSDDSAMDKLFPLFLFDEHTGIFQYDYAYAVKELSTFLIANNHAMYDGFEMLELFLKIFKHQQKGTVPAASKSNATVYVEATEQYIHSNIHRPITVTELTAFLGVSQPYLFKIFRDRFQKSPKQYMLEQKLLYAQRLLKETSMSVSYIANSVGFTDVLSFSRYFRGKTGLSPQKYRKQEDAVSLRKNAKNES